MTAPRAWLGLHIFYHNLLKQDDLLTQCIAPTIQELQAEGACTDWFFLRYWEGGPHLRVRLLNPSAAVEPLLRERITVFLAEHPPEREWTREQYYANHTFDGEPVDIATLPWYPNGTILSLPYAPEYKRYGGTAAMPVSEFVFHHSSVAALEVIEATRENFGQRLSLAMDLMVLTALCMRVQPEALAHYFSRYTSYWQGFEAQSDAALQRLNKMWEQNRPSLVPRMRTLFNFAKGQEDAPIYRRFVDRLREAVQRYEGEPVRGDLQCPFDDDPVETDARVAWVVSSIAFSQIHMTNNRLGLTPQLEHLLGGLIQRAVVEAREEASHEHAE